MKLTLVLPCWSRPALTERAIRSVLAQAETFTGAEVFFLGDACPHYQAIVDSEWFTAERLRVAGRLTIITGNRGERDGTPTPNINFALAGARGEYFCWMGNDDRLLPGHFANYYSFCKEHDLDMGYFDSQLEAINNIGGSTGWRHAGLQYGCVGHSEICVRTALARELPPHHRGYGHDWDFIRALVERPGAKLKHSPTATYVVNVGPRENTYQNGTT